MATAPESMEIDFGTLWLEADRIRKERARLSRSKLFAAYLLRGGRITNETLLTYLSGRSEGARIADANEYNLIATILNERLTEIGDTADVPYIVLTTGNSLRGRDSNPQPSGSESAVLLRMGSPDSDCLEPVENGVGQAA